MAHTETQLMQTAPHEEKRSPISEDNPLAVRLYDPPLLTVGGITLRPELVVVPGIGTGAAYAALDQIGTLFRFPDVTRPGVQTGVLHAACYYDLSDQGIQVDLWLFSAPVTLAADNAAFVLSDADLLKVEYVVQFTDFNDANTGQYSVVPSIGYPFRTVGGTSLYAAVQSRGTPTITAAMLPHFRLAVLAD